MGGEQAGVGHVDEAGMLLRRTREDERAARLLAQAGVDGEGGAEIHRVAGGVADDRVRAGDGPGEAVRLGGGEQDVFLGVVEILAGDARLVLGEGRVELVLGEVVERAEIVLEAGDQGGVAQAAGGGGRLEGVAEHGAVDAAVLGLGRLAAPGDEEEVRGGRGAGERGAGRRLVGEVAGDVLDGRHVRRAVAGDADDVPAAGRRQSIGEGAAADAADAEDDRYVVCHARSMFLVASVT